MSSDNVDRVVPPVVIVLHLPAPFDPVEITFSASEIAKPTIKSDPTTTIFDREWQTTIFRKTIQTIELTLAQHGTLTDNEHFTKLQEVLEYPYISKHKFGWYFQCSVQYISFFIEIDQSQVLQLFSKIYSGKYQNRALVLHLKLEGAAYRHLRNAFSLKSQTTLVDCKIESTPLSQTDTSAVPIVLEVHSKIVDSQTVETPFSSNHLALSDFCLPVNLVTDTSHFFGFDEPSLPSSTAVSTQTFGSADSTIFNPGDTVKDSAVQISPQPSISVLFSPSTRTSHRIALILDLHAIPDGAGLNADQAALFSNLQPFPKNFDGNFFTESISHWFTLRRRPPDLRSFCTWSPQTKVDVPSFPRFSTASHFLGHFVYLPFRDLTASASLLFAELPKPPDIYSNAWILNYHARKVTCLIPIHFQAGSTSAASISDFGLSLSSFLRDSLNFVYAEDQSILWMVVDCVTQNLTATLLFGTSKFVFGDSAHKSTVISKIGIPFSSAFLFFVPLLFIISDIFGIMFGAHDKPMLFIVFAFVWRFRASSRGGLSRSEPLLCCFCFTIHDC
jgi:hypothetical protein